MTSSYIQAKVQQSLEQQRLQTEADQARKRQKEEQFRQEALEFVQRKFKEEFISDPKFIEELQVTYALREDVPFIAGEVLFSYNQAVWHLYNSNGGWYVYAYTENATTYPPEMNWTCYYGDLSGKILLWMGQWDTHDEEKTKLYQKHMEVQSGQVVIATDHMQTADITILRIHLEDADDDIEIALTSYEVGKLIGLFTSLQHVMKR